MTAKILIDRSTIQQVSDWFKWFNAGNPLEAVWSSKQCSTALRAALDQPALAQQPAVPPGYKLVPVEPTPEMKDVQTWDYGAFRPASEIWADMLNAAPEATAVQKEPVAWMYDWLAHGHDKPVCDWISQDKDEVFDQRNGYFNIRPLYTHHTPAAQPQTEGKAVAALTKVLHIIQNYLPPDGPNINDAMSEIIGIVDPWPLDTQPEPLAAQKEQP